MKSENSSEEYSLSILVPTQFVGLLIGKNGSCFRDLAKNSKCRLFLQSYEDIPELSRERVLTMSGSKVSVLVALRKVIEIIQPCTKSMGSQVGTWESQADGNQIIKWVILQSDCGTLIGRGGEGIKRINELSGSWVKVAHLEDSVRGVKERLVYIRGTPEQNIHALQIIIDKVGGWPYTTPVYDTDIARIEDKTSMFIPFLAIPYVLFETNESEEFHGLLFPTESKQLPQIAGAVINLDANFYTSSAEAQIHIIGHIENREKAKSIIMSRLNQWLKNQTMTNPDWNSGSGSGSSSGPATSRSNTTVSEDRGMLLPNGTSTAGTPLSAATSSVPSTSATTNLSLTASSILAHATGELEFNPTTLSEEWKPVIPKQYSAQFADQFTVLPPHLQPSKPGTLTVEEYMARLRYDIDQNNNNSNNNHNQSSTTNTTTAVSGMNSGGVHNIGVGDGESLASRSPCHDPTSDLTSMSYDIDSIIPQSNSSDFDPNSPSDILDCGVKMLISSDSINWFETPFNQSYSEQNIFEYIHSLTHCYLQSLPSHNVVSKSCEVKKISIIGSSLTSVLKAQELLLDFVQVYKPDAHPQIPIQIDKKKVIQHQQQLLMQSNNTNNHHNHHTHGLMHNNNTMGGGVGGGGYSSHMNNNTMNMNNMGMNNSNYFQYNNHSNSTSMTNLSQLAFGGNNTNNMNNNNNGNNNNNNFNLLKSNFGNNNNNNGGGNGMSMMMSNNGNMNNNNNNSMSTMSRGQTGGGGGGGGGDAVTEKLIALSQQQLNKRENALNGVQNGRPMSLPHNLPSNFASALHSLNNLTGNNNNNNALMMNTNNNNSGNNNTMNINNMSRNNMNNMSLRQPFQMNNNNTNSYASMGSSSGLDFNPNMLNNNPNNLNMGNKIGSKSTPVTPRGGNGGTNSMNFNPNNMNMNPNSMNLLRNNMNTMSIDNTGNINSNNGNNLLSGGLKLNNNMLGNTGGGGGANLLKPPLGGGLGVGGGMNKNDDMTTTTNNNNNNNNNSATMNNNVFLNMFMNQNMNANSNLSTMNNPNPSMMNNNSTNLLSNNMNSTTMNAMNLLAGNTSGTNNIIGNNNNIGNTNNFMNRSGMMQDSTNPLSNPLLGMKTMSLDEYSLSTNRALLNANMNGNNTNTSFLNALNVQTSTNNNLLAGSTTNPNLLNNTFVNSLLNAKNNTLGNTGNPSQLSSLSTGNNNSGSNSNNNKMVSFDENTLLAQTQFSPNTLLNNNNNMYAPPGLTPSSPSSTVFSSISADTNIRPATGFGTNTTNSNNNGTNLLASTTNSSNNMNMNTMFNGLNLPPGDFSLLSTNNNNNNMITIDPRLKDLSLDERNMLMNTYMLQNKWLQQQQQQQQQLQQLQLLQLQQEHQQQAQQQQQQMNNMNMNNNNMNLLNGINDSGMNTQTSAFAMMGALDNTTTNMSGTGNKNLLAAAATSAGMNTNSMLGNNMGMNESMYTMMMNNGNFNHMNDLTSATATMNLGFNSPLSNLSGFNNVSGMFSNTQQQNNIIPSIVGSSNNNLLRPQSTPLTQDSTGSTTTPSLDGGNNMNNNSSIFNMNHNDNYFANLIKLQQQQQQQQQQQMRIGQSTDGSTSTMLGSSTIDTMNMNMNMNTTSSSSFMNTLPSLLNNDLFNNMPGNTGNSSNMYGYNVTDYLAASNTTTTTITSNDNETSTNVN